MQLSSPKGTEDYSSEKKILRDEIVETIKKIFERYGFNPLETPTLEKYSTLSAKYAGGSEILKETFKLKDQGERELGLRYDLTVPLARYIAMNPQIGLPFKRYEISKVFRDGPITKNRIREFWQLDADIVGAKSLLADVEIIQLALDIIKELKLKCKIKINNRKLLNEIIEYAKIQKNTDTIILTIDKLYKIGKENVIKELKQKSLSDKQIKKLLNLILIKGKNKEKLNKISKEINKEGIKELKEVLKFFKKDVEFDPSLARGLSYYTGTVLEITIEDKSLGCSIGGGGRYDNMIGSFIGKEKVPAVGISFGLEPLTTALKNLRKPKKTVTQVYIIPIKTLEKSLKIANKLRDGGINIDIDLNQRSISKNLNYANKWQIPYVIFIGENELKQNKVKLRDMKTGEERLLALEEISITLRKALKRKE